MKISEIDKNFKQTSLPEGVELDYYDIEEGPFKIFGVKKENGMFRRMPEAVAKAVSESTADAVSEGVYLLHTHTAGGRVCFKTDSRYVSIYAKMGGISKMSHCSTVGSAGFDLYVKNRFTAAFEPDYDCDDVYNIVRDLENNSLKEITVNFPPYSEVISVHIGVEKESVLEEYNPYTGVSPIVYYGSSITQGACASRPGNSYQAEICRRTGVDYVNLGFSGSARGEQKMAEYIADLDMSVFVMDYDHNAPTPEHLRDTHEKFFEIIRNKNKDLPVIFVSKPDFWDTDEDIERLGIVRTTYENALAKGDKNVYFIPGSSFFERVSRDFCTVDRCHPNDLGFYCMAEIIGEKIETVLR